MRGYKGKMLSVAMANDEVTSRDFATVTGLPAPQTSPYARLLEREGYLKLHKEVPLERGGRPLKIYKWTGKNPPSATTQLDSMWGHADRVAINCINRMVRCRESNDALACAV
jgi:predicted transcriptional regulator